MRTRTMQGATCRMSWERPDGPGVLRLTCPQLHTACRES
jgi:hypothetical protein